MTKPKIVTLYGSRLYGIVRLEKRKEGERITIDLSLSETPMTPTAARQIASILTRLANHADARRGRPKVVGETTRAWEVEIKSRSIFVSRTKKASCDARHNRPPYYTCDLLKGHSGGHVAFFFDEFNGRPKEIVVKWPRMRRRKRK